MKINWSAIAKWTMVALGEAPAVIRGVETIRGQSANDAAKTDEAATALTLATHTAAEVDPNDAEAMQGLQQMGAAIIAACKQPPPVAPGGPTT